MVPPPPVVARLQVRHLLTVARSTDWSSRRATPISTRSSAVQSIVPAVAVVWSSQQPQSRALLDDAIDIATALEGRVQVVGIDVATNPGIMQAVQPPEVPPALGLVSGQPVPLFSGMVDKEQFRAVVDQLLQWPSRTA
uniref:Uncharacterized protein n=1 Tax=Janibacter limosus TaxID=53458 RepID=A0AC61U6G4_9MICO|nr:hypothetical protein [Janibacter limosus]